jgi:ATP-binding cassette subfamily B protein
VPPTNRPGLAHLNHGLRTLAAAAVRVSPQLRRGLPLTIMLALLAGAGRIIAPLTVQHAVDAGLTPGTVGPAVAVGAAAVLVAAGPRFC